MPRRCRCSGEKSRGFAQTPEVGFPNGNQASEADARRASLGRKVGRSHDQGDATTTHASSAAAGHAGIGADRGATCALNGRHDLRSSPCPIVRRRDAARRAGLVGSKRVVGDGRSAMRLRLKALDLKAMPIRAVRMTDMGLGCDRRELNGDQQDRRPKDPQKLSGRIHGRTVPYGRSQGNIRQECSKCMVTALISINDRICR